jgi:hypothetical protein
LFEQNERRNVRAKEKKEERPERAGARNGEAGALFEA